MSENTKNETTKPPFDAVAATLLTTELRETFASGKTRSYEWRASQLHALSRLVADHEKQIVDALRNDLDKPPLETVAYEVSRLCSDSCRLFHSIAVTSCVLIFVY